MKILFHYIVIISLPDRGLYNLIVIVSYFWTKNCIFYVSTYVYRSEFIRPENSQGFANLRKPGISAYKNANAL